MRAIYRDAPAMRRKAVWTARFILLYLAGAVALPIVLGVPILALLLTAHLAVGHWLRWLVGGPMHAGLRDNVPDFRLCVRSNTLDPISEFLYWGMNWHTEHHMYAGVPCYNLARLYRVIRDDVPKPRTLLGSWREILAIWKRQQGGSRLPVRHAPAAHGAPAGAVAGRPAAPLRGRRAVGTSHSTPSATRSPR